jgi:hypothetical protein
LCATANLDAQLPEWVKGLGRGRFAACLLPLTAAEWQTFRLGQKLPYAAVAVDQLAVTPMTSKAASIVA